MMMLIVVAVVGVVLMAVVDNRDIIRAAIQKTIGTYTIDGLLTQSTDSWVDEYITELGVRKLEQLRRRSIC